MTKIYCCEMMTNQVNHTCAQHPGLFECVDQVISYSPEWDEYGLIVHDGGSSSYHIDFCPWCGINLPDSKREQWFLELANLGFDDPWSQDVPEKYKSDEWYKNT